MVKPLAPKCPHCDSPDFAEVSPGVGTSYVLTEVNTQVTPPSFLATSGMPIKIYGCLDCGICILYNPSLRRE